MKTFLLFVALGIVAALPASAQSTAQSFNCMVAHLRVNSDRFFVRCHASYSGVEIPPFVKDIPYYSAPYSQANARMMLDLIMSGRAQGKSIRIIFDDEPSRNPSGCQPGNCRRIVAAGINY